MLRIKIPCNRATSCNSSGRLKPPSSQCLRLACPRTDTRSRRRHSSRPAQHLASPRSLTLLSLRCGIRMQRIKIPCWLGTVQASLTLLSLRCGIVNCELNVMHAANPSHACTKLGTCMYHPRFMHAIFEGDSFSV